MNGNNNNNNNNNNESDFVKWWKEQPVVTRTIAAGMVGVTAVHSIGLVSPYKLIFDAAAIYKRFEIWRLFTAPLIHNLGLSFLINMLTFYRHSSQLEQGDFLGRTADYAWMLLVCLPALWLGSYVLRLSVLTPSFMMVVIYYWSKKYPDQVMSFMFGLRFLGVNLPWVLCAFHVLLGGSPLPDLLGIAVGHIFWFITCVLPNTHKIELVSTPAWLRKVVPNSNGPAGIRYANGAFVPNNNVNRGGNGNVWGEWARERDQQDQQWHHQPQPQQQQQQQQQQQGGARRRRDGGHVLGEE